MGTTADKLNKLLETKAAIKNAIIAKGVEVADSDTFASYPAKIDSIEVGGGSDEFLAIRTNNGTDMSHLFYNYQGSELDISSWNTDNVTDMEYMFYNCCNLKSLDLSNFNTNNVTNMESMFVGCTNLERLDLSNFIINSSLYGILVGCDKLQELRLDNCNNDTISKIINSYGFPTGAISGVTRKIYVNPDNLGILRAPENWIFVDLDGNEIRESKIYQVGYYRNDSKITEATTMVNNTHTDLSWMFYGCNNLITINNIDQWDTSNVNDMNSMFNSCENLPYLDLSSFNTSGVTDMDNMFYGCTDLLYLDISNFNVSEDCATGKSVFGTDSGMFWDCTSLLDLRLDNCDSDTINRIINSNGFRVNPNNIIEDLPRVVYVREKNKGHLTLSNGSVFGYIEDPIYIKRKDDETKREYINDREVVNVIVDTQTDSDRYEDNNLERLFENCRSLRLINGIEQWNTTGIERMSYMFAGCTHLVSLNLSSFDISNAREIHNMFERCTNLRYLDISNFIMGEEYYRYTISDMFRDCNNLRHLRLDNCDRNTIDKIINESNLPTGDINGEKRKMYVQEANITNEWGDKPEARDGWEFIYLIEPKKEEE